jgi:hypothetical protein
MSALLYGQMLDRLSHAQVRDLAMALEFAVRGRVPQADLAQAVERIAKSSEREQAGGALRAWLVERAKESEPPARRHAA